jgi:hypothetical protein
MGLEAVMSLEAAMSLEAVSWVFLAYAGGVSVCRGLCRGCLGLEAAGGLDVEGV